jgi:hypothetical protein
MVSCFSFEAFATVLKDIAVFEGSEVLVIRSTLPPEHFLAVN